MVIHSKQPDISYHPDVEKWQARTQKRLAEDPTLPNWPLPEGFPEQLESPLVWEGKDWKDEKEWVVELDEGHLKEVGDALDHFKQLGVPSGLISPVTFPLPTLGPLLRDGARELHSGRGFFVLRGVPVSSYPRTDIVLIYAGISSYVANLRGKQDVNNRVLAHIKDLTQTDHLKTIGAPAYTTDKQVFHTDIGDIVSLFALETALEGGVSRISSTWRVYNELARTRPDLIRTLSEPWPFDTFGAPPGFISRPILYHEDKHIILQYARRSFTGFLHLPRSKDIPNITEAQAEALDAVHFLGEKFNLGLNFQKGDIQFINNLAVFHARDGFVDGPNKQRHLLRLWLRNEDLAWQTPEPLKPQWEKLYYTVPVEEQTFPPEPIIRNASGVFQNKEPSTDFAPVSVPVAVSAY